MKYLSSQEMLYIHYRLTQEMGGDQGSNNIAILKKLAKYLHNNDIFPDRFSKAAGLLFAIAKRKPFTDLNKKSALLITKIFLSLNDEDFQINNLEVIDFAKNKLSSASVEDIKKIIIYNTAPLG